MSKRRNERHNKNKQYFKRVNNREITRAKNFISEGKAKKRHFIKQHNIIEAPDEELKKRVKQVYKKQTRFSVRPRQRFRPEAIVTDIVDEKDKVLKTLKTTAANSVDDGTSVLQHKAHVVLNKATKSLNQLSSGFMNRWTKLPKYGKAGILIGAGVVAFDFIRSTIGHKFGAPNKIPSKYEKGYDTIQNHFTDFGSPVKLYKVASKIITPYHSSVRRGLKTTTNSVLKSNPALVSSKYAIGHTRY